MPRRSFKVAVATEPISFDLEGQKSGFRNFVCRDRLAAGTLMRFAETFASLEDEEESTGQNNGAEAIPAIREYFNKCLLPTNHELFWSMINDDDEGITIETLVEIAGWLSEVYSGSRPTGETSAPGSGVTSSGGGSAALLPPVDTPTYSRPELTPSSI